MRSEKWSENGDVNTDYNNQRYLFKVLWPEIEPNPFFENNCKIPSLCCQNWTWDVVHGIQRRLCGVKL